MARAHRGVLASRVPVRACWLLPLEFVPKVRTRGRGSLDTPLETPLGGGNAPHTTSANRIEFDGTRAMRLAIYI